MGLGSTTRSMFTHFSDVPDELELCYRLPWKPEMSDCRGVFNSISGFNILLGDYGCLKRSSWNNHVHQESHESLLLVGGGA